MVAETQVIERNENCVVLGGAVTMDTFQQVFTLTFLSGFQWILICVWPLKGIDKFISDSELFSKFERIWILSIVSAW